MQNIVTKKRLLCIGIGCALLMVAGGIFLVTRPEGTYDTAVQGDQTAVHEYDYRDGILGFGFKFSYKEPLKEERLSSQDTEDGFLARLSAYDPALLLSVRRETGLRTPAQFAKTDVETMLGASIDKSLPDRYPEFTLESSTALEVGGKRALERVFSYRGPSGARAKQRLTAVLVDDNTALYISFQSTERVYDTVSDDYLKPLLSSVSFN